METVCIKMDESLKSDIDSTLKRYRYSTMTEFIREAIRDKLRDLEWEEITPEKIAYLEKRLEESKKNLKVRKYTLKDV